MRKEIWFAKDRDSWSVGRFLENPTFDVGTGCWTGNALDYDMDDEAMEEMFGVTLKEGEQLKITIEKLGK